MANLWTRLENWERSVRHSFGRDISTPRERRLSKLHYHLFDHAFLRTFWTNFDEIAPQVYRSNQPTHRRFQKYRKMGIRTVINLRGEDGHAHYLFEKESCEALGLTLINAKLWARHAPAAPFLLNVIDAMRAAERPFLIHCKSGADRTGLAGAMYLMAVRGVPVETARKQLSLRYIHLKWTKTGIQDYILDVYAARVADRPIGFEDWLKDGYDDKALQKGFDTKVPARDMARLV